MGSYIRHCERCREVIFNGRVSNDDYMEIDGEYEYGAGRCKKCGRELCWDCGDITDGLCEECRELEEEE
jgi:hypothetical protein